MGHAAVTPIVPAKRRSRWLRRFAALALLLSAPACGLQNAGGVAPAAPSPAARTAAARPEIRSQNGVVSFALTAVMDPSNSFPTFEYKGDYDVAPTIRVKPGDSIVVDLSNELPRGKNMSGDVNLHFHGLGTSPNRPADDVLTMMATPGHALHYVVPVPKSQPPGLYWYHTHIHGETNYQVGEGGMAGAIVVEGIAKHYPSLKSMRENILIVQELGSGAGSIESSLRRRGLAVNHPCYNNGALISINRIYGPTITIAPGERQFFRILNATGHRNLDLQLDGISMQIVAIDGYPLDLSSGPPVRTVSDYVLPPAGRVEFVATGTPKSVLRTLCYNSGPAGDEDPAQVLAYLAPPTGSMRSARPPVMPPIRSARVDAPAPLPSPVASRLVTLTEDANGFYINGRAFEPSDKPTFTVHTGTVEQWTVQNLTEEVHDFHMHQVHFMVESINGVPVANPVWNDSVVVPHEINLHGGKTKPGYIVLLADFRNPLIRGVFLFHCHILDHEDMGMMAKLLAL